MSGRIAPSLFVSLHVKPFEHAKISNDPEISSGMKKKYAKSLCKSYFLNYHLENYFYKNHFLYFFILQ
jgi:hypothetical protein